MTTPQYRKATKADVRAVDAAPGSLWSRLIGSFLILGCGVFALAFLLTKSMRPFDERPVASVVFAALPAALLFSLSAYSIVGHHRDTGRLEGRLSEPKPIEMLEVRASRVLEIEAPGSTGPALCFELPDGQILLLYGQWLLEPDLYRAPRPVGDGNDAHFNGLDAPHAFPADHYVLHRWRGGEVRPFWIEVRGRYLPPEQSSVRLPSARNTREVEFFPGSLESLQEDLSTTPARAAT